MIAAANFLIMGPLLVGVPVLAQTRFVEGALAFGVIMSAYAIGNLGGYVGAGALPRPSASAFSVAVVALFVLFGGAVISLGFITSMWFAAALMVVLGLGNGYVAVMLMSAIQRMAPQEMLGRVMSLVVLAMVGLAPISQAVAGAVIKTSPAVLFGVAGGLLVALGVFAGLRHRSWSFDMVEPPRTDVDVAAEVA
jgi:MFS family permease